jgi:hypothetical protein
MCSTLQYQWLLFTLAQLTRLGSHTYVARHGVDWAVIISELRGRVGRISELGGRVDREAEAL